MPPYGEKKLHRPEENIFSMNSSISSITLDRSIKQLDKSAWVGETQKNEETWKTAITFVARTWCFTSVLHGVKYLAEPRRPQYERFTWFIVLLGLVALCLHLVWVTSFSELSSPLLVNLESSSHPIWKYDFPAVTICSNTKLNRTNAQKWASSIVLPPNLTEEDVINYLPNLLHLLDFANNPEIEILDTVLKLNNITADELYLSMSINCQDLLVECRLNNIKYECFNLFKTIRTTEGYCCSFNYFGTASQYYLNRYFKESNITPKAPLRMTSNGRNTGLSVVVRTKLDGYGTLMASHGTKVLLHVATNYPDHLVIQRLVQPDHVDDFRIMPSIIRAGKEIRKLPIENRNCIFFDEKQLDGFQSYSYKSCIFNCRLNVFFTLCGCVPFYYPIHKDTQVPTCGLKDVHCLATYRNEILALRRNLTTHPSIVETPICGCLPQCNELTYEVATSTFRAQNEFKKNIFPKEQDGEAFSEIHVYFRSLFGTKYQRLQPSTTYQMLANFGGLLGLFMGFSFISLFELIYSFTLRILFHMHVSMQNRQKSDQKN